MFCYHIDQTCLQSAVKHTKKLKKLGTILEMLLLRNKLEDTELLKHFQRMFKLRQSKIKPWGKRNAMELHPVKLPGTYLARSAWEDEHRKL